MISIKAYLNSEEKIFAGGLFLFVLNFIRKNSDWAGINIS
jgi:hypothetical protein